MKILVVTPIAKEVDCFLHSCAEQGIRSETMMLGKLPVTHFPALGVIASPSSRPPLAESTNEQW